MSMHEYVRMSPIISEWISNMKNWSENWSKCILITYICKWCVLEPITLSKEPWSEVVDRIDGELEELELGGGETEPPSEWKPSSTWSVSIVEDDRLQESGNFNVSPVYIKRQRKHKERGHQSKLKFWDYFLCQKFEFTTKQNKWI